MRGLWANGTLQRLAHSTAVEPMHAAAQQALQLQGPSLEASETAMPSEQVVDLVIQELGLSHTEVLRMLHSFGSSCSGVAIVQQVSLESPFVYNSAAIQCNVVARRCACYQIRAKRLL